jgi:hypothetical protein
MPRFAVQWPHTLSGLPDADFNGARQEFIRQFNPVIFMPQWSLRLTRGFNLKRNLKHSKLVDVEKLDFAFSVRELNKKADILINFNSFPVNLEKLEPPRGFDGLKIWHVFEYVFYSAKVNTLLEKGGVDYVLGYSDHGVHCPFFQKHFPKYIDRVIPFPFGTCRRFIVDSKKESRLSKVVALGSVNLVNEPNVERGSLDEYTDFYQHKQWTHEWRNILRENSSNLKDILDSYLPKPPAMKNPSYDAVDMMTKYSLFANDEGLMAFPPARTYEGPAAGCCMIGSDFNGYRELGFRDGINCILHRKHDLDHFRTKASHWLQRPNELRRIADAGKRLIRNFYTHEAIAHRLESQLNSLYSSGRKPDTDFPESKIPI